MSGPSEFDILESAGAGMVAERAALDLAARNVAASQADGPAFARLVPQFAFGSGDAEADSPDADFEPPDEPDSTPADALAAPADASQAPQLWAPDGALEDDVAERALPVRYLGARRATGTAPDAISEMVAVLDAQRAYDANASVFDVGKRLAERTIDMGRVQ